MVKSRAKGMEKKGDRSKVMLSKSNSLYENSDLSPKPGGKIALGPLLLNKVC